MSTAAIQTVSAVERFGFTLFFATAIHAVAIIGITFTAFTNTPPQKTIEITLAQFQQEDTPDQADFFAQSNQAGSGHNQEKHLPSVQQKAEFQDTTAKQIAAIQTPTPSELREIQPAAEQTKQPSKSKVKTQSQPARKQVIAQRDNPKKKTATRAKQKTSDPASGSSTPGTQTSLLARSLEIASLQAEIDSQREIRAKQPRIKRLTSAATQKREDALYLDNWRKKIENVGNLNYPEEARRQKMYGRLRLLVAIKPDGSVNDIEVLESSGQPVLDDAAIRIVRLAAPFQPFPVEMRKSTDVLEIIRTWKFEKRAYIY